MNRKLLSSRSAKNQVIIPRAILVLATMMLTVSGFSQKDCPCCSDMHRQFDFWVGDWVVHDTSGTFLGENSIVKLENGCILNECWRGAKGGTGRSYNYFNLKDSTWNQLWIDSQGNHLELKGHGSENKMVLQSDIIQGSDGKQHYNRITWTAYPDGSVIQLWEILDEKKEPIKTAFQGIYTPRKKSE